VKTVVSVQNLSESSKTFIGVMAICRAISGFILKMLQTHQFTVRGVHDNKSKSVVYVCMSVFFLLRARS
jgi:glucose uptake protein GlcU